MHLSWFWTTLGSRWRQRCKSWFWCWTTPHWGSDVDKYVDNYFGHGFNTDRHMYQMSSRGTCLGDKLHWGPDPLWPCNRASQKGRDQGTAIFVFVFVSYLTLYFSSYLCLSLCLSLRLTLQGGFFNCSSPFSVPKWKNLLSQRGAFLHWKFLEKVVLVGCNLFFILVLKIGRNS